MWNSDSSQSFTIRQQRVFSQETKGNRQPVCLANKLQKNALTFGCHRFGRGAYLNTHDTIFTIPDSGPNQELSHDSSRPDAWFQQR